MAGVLDLPTLIQKVRVNADTKDGEAETKGALDRISSGFTKVGVGLTAAVTVPIVGMAVAGIKAASDLSESNSKVGVVFGDNADKVREFAKTAASSMGISQQAALEASGTFGNLFRALGVGTGPAADMSTSMVKLASDLASFNNANPDDVLIALRSGLLGEAEPLRAFGVSLSAARIEAEALSSGLVKTTGDQTKITTSTIAVEKANQAAAKALKEHGKESLEYRDAAAKAAKAEQDLTDATKGQVPELTAAQKAQASFNIIQKDTALAQGDFSRTSSGLANQQRILAAQFVDMKATLGSALLPVIQTVIGHVTGLFKAFQNLSPGVQKTIEVFAAVAAAIGPLLLIAGKLISSVSAIAGVFGGGGAAAGEAAAGGGLLAAMGPVIPILLAVAAAAFVIYKNWDHIRPLFEKVTKVVGGLVKGFQMFFYSLKSGFTEDEGTPIERFALKIRDAAKTVAHWLSVIVGFFQKMAPDVEEALGHIGKVIEVIFKIIVQIVQVGLGVMAALWRAWGDDLWNIVKAIFGTIQEVIRGVVEVIRGIIVTVLALINGDWGKAWDGIKGIFDGIWDAIIGILRGAFDILSSILGAYVSVFQEIWSGLWDIIKGVFQGAWDFIAGIFTAAWDLIIGILKTYIDIYVAIFTTAWNVIVAIVKGAWDFIVGLVTYYVGLVRDIITTVIGGIVGFLQGVWDVILGALGTAWGAIVGAVKWFLADLWQGIQNIVGAIADLFGHAFDWFRGLVDGVTRVRDTVLDVLGNMLGFFASIPGRIADVAGKVAAAAIDMGQRLIGGIKDGIAGAIGFVGDVGKSLFNAVARFVNDHIFSKINDFHVSILGHDVDFPDIPLIPLLARGGGYAGPFIAGERGPELVIPKAPQGQVLSNSRTMDLLESLATRNGSTGGSSQPLFRDQIINGLSPEQVTAATIRAQRRIALDWETT